MKQTIKKLLRDYIADLVGDVSFEILTPPDPSLGDYATNVAFVIAKKEGKKPAETATELKDALESTLGEMATMEVSPNGFLNFFLKPEFLQKRLLEVKYEAQYGRGGEGAGKKVIIEYPSCNVAKPMHIGHLRSTIIGDALANVYETLGYDVIRWNYFGDWGTQFGKLIASYKRWLDKEAFENDPVGEMLRLYVKFHAEAASNPELEKEGQAEFKKLEEGDNENRKIWSELREESLKDFDRIFKRLGTRAFDQTKGESDYESELKPIIAYLQEKGFARESEGALIIDLAAHGLPPALLRKSDGATLYMTRDLASLGDRIKTYQPEKILYVVANQQALHFEQLFAAARDLKLGDAGLVHVKFGMVLGEDGKKLATREGKVVAAEEVIDKIVALAREKVIQKNPDLSSDEADKIANSVGLGGLKYNDLKQHPHSDIVFDWDAMLDLSGNSGPYIQYTYARLANILAKAGAYSDGDVSMLVEPSERALMKKLLDFPDAIGESAKLYTLNGLALYLYELAHAANQFYEQVRVLEDDNNDRKNARLTVIATVASTLKQGLKLLGIEALERI